MPDTKLVFIPHRIYILEIFLRLEQTAYTTAKRLQITIIEYKSHSWGWDRWELANVTVWLLAKLWVS